MTDHCPTCGAPVRVVSTDVGTNHYTPVEPDDTALADCWSKLAAREAQSNRLAADLATAEAEAARLRAELVEVAGLRWLPGPGPGGSWAVKLKAPRELVFVLAEGLADMLRERQAANCVEWSVNHPDVGVLTLTLQRQEGRTPMDLCAEAQAERDRLRALIRDYIAGCEAVRAATAAETAQTAGALLLLYAQLRAAALGGQNASPADEEGTQGAAGGGGGGEGQRGEDHV